MLKLEQTIAVPSVLTTDANNRATLPANSQRVSVIIGNPNGTGVYWLFRESPGAAAGIPLNANSFAELEGSHYGTAVQDEIRFIAAAAGLSIACVEILSAI